MIVMALIINLGCGLSIYLFLKRKRKQIHERLLHDVAKCSSGVISLTVMMNLQLLLQMDHSMMFACIFGVIIGVIYRTLERYPLIGNYYEHGFMSGLMGAMVSIVVLNPSLCGLPAEYGNALEKNAVTLSFFSSFLAVLTVFVVYYILRGEFVDKA